MNRIPITECVNGGFYKIHSRNLISGVYVESCKGYIGIREKFGEEYLFTEYDWETGAPFGTVTPTEFIEMCPIQDLNEFNNLLFNWIKEKDSQRR